MTRNTAIDALNINDKCFVQWRGGIQRLQAIVVERRPKGILKKRKKSEKTPKLEDLSGDEIEYYVHYVGHDRRLDEWVTIDKFILDTLERYDESNMDIDTTARGIRRRSSFGPSEDQQSDSEITSAEQLLAGGNWHGASGDPALETYEREHEETTKVKNIEKIIMGDYEVEAWYYSPFPAEYSNLETLYVCEYCLSYMKKVRTFLHHRATCTHRHPPGKQIYREEDICVYELDGKDHRAYCQKLCLLAKLFLDHKTLFFEPKPFLFYVVAKVDDTGAHIVGYFSKEKTSDQGYNLACILTFPQYQKCGYGKFIISVSYALTKREGKTGSPEKPLSDLGKVSYRSYWTYVIMTILANHDPSEDISIESMAESTGIRVEDLISTLQALDMIKVWKGQYVVYVRQSAIREYMSQLKPLRLCKPDSLDWNPPTQSSTDSSKGK